MTLLGSPHQRLSTPSPPHRELVLRPDRTRLELDPAIAARGIGRPPHCSGSSFAVDAATRLAEVLRELEPLCLIVRAGPDAVQHAGALGHALVHQATDDLPVLQNEGHIAGTHFEHRPRPLPACGGVAEARVEETCIVDAELS